MDPRQTQHPRFAITIFFTFLCVLLIWWVLPRHNANDIPLPIVTKAVTMLTGNTVSGTVTFTQTSPTGVVTISGSIENLDPSAKRGFHIHAAGDLSAGCASAGAHFNPFGKTHGSPSATARHVGDLGNIESNPDGVASFVFRDSLISLNGPLSIVGRAVVVHAGTDDLGLGGDDESLKTGNAGARAACGVIGIA
ncbi:Superoxide dismutase [Cu-Zn] [Grifola frondosa]|uniref:Superoxide dismutase [Cu-Zn] n=1 Tax=Grifola frondosa TaxID=5627 RepID=A0A1C7M396_GRIFR|nr:Superoxide dismutase [Cu-Zn] [Grifola frondosa]